MCAHGGAAFVGCCGRMHVRARVGERLSESAGSGGCRDARASVRTWSAHPRLERLANGADMPPAPRFPQILL
eukprot:6185303-Pleurochrysis_carterae.AAC.1